MGIILKRSVSLYYFNVNNLHCIVIAINIDTSYLLSTTDHDFSSLYTRFM